MSFQEASTAYANNNQFIIYIQHVATGYFTSFKGFMTSFEDSFVCDWNDVNVYGRMDPISTYQGTRRQINFGFDVVAFDLEEALRNFQQSRNLISQLYPVYKKLAGDQFSATAMQAPPLLRIRFANLISSAANGDGMSAGLLGKIGGLSYAPDMEAGFFTSPRQIIPKVNRFSFNFTVFHTDEIGFDGGAPVDADVDRWRSNPAFPYPKTPAATHVEQVNTSTSAPPISTTPRDPASTVVASSPGVTPVGYGQSQESIAAAEASGRDTAEQRPNTATQGVVLASDERAVNNALLG